MSRKAQVNSMLIKVVLGVVIMGIIILGATTGISKNFNNFDKRIKDVDGNDISLSDQNFDEDDYMTTEGKIAMHSLETLAMAINALAKNDEIKHKHDPLSKKVKITYYAEFDQEQGKDIQSQCSHYVSTVGKKTVNCKSYLDEKYMDDKLTPRDIEKVTSFKVEVDGKTCLVDYPHDTFGGLDLIGMPKNTDNCMTAPNRVDCSGISVYYCGKTLWSITSYVNLTNEKDSQFKKVSDFKRDGWIGAGFSKINGGINLIKGSVGIKTDLQKNSFCEDGQVFGLEDEHQMCVYCDMDKYNGNGQCAVTEFELPQKITPKESESWLQGYGDPAFIVYSEVFPQGEEESWQVSEMTILSAGLTVGFIALDFIPLVGKGAGVVVKKITKEVGDATVKKVGTKISQSYAKSTLKKLNSIVDEIDEVGEVITKKSSKELAKESITNQRNFFLSNFKALIKNADQFDEALFKKSVLKMDKVLKNLPKGAKAELFEKTAKMSDDIIDEGGSVIWKNILDEPSTLTTKSLENSLIGITSSGEHASLMGQIVLGMKKFKRGVEVGTVGAGAASIALYSAWLDAGNEKYTPAGYNTLSLSKVSSFEQRSVIDLANEAKDMFIRLDKDEKDGVFTNRFFLASPCKTDLDIRKEKCTCSVENVVKNKNNIWQAYLKETDSGYIPVTNVADVTEDSYELETFHITDTRAAGIKGAQIVGVMTPAGGLIAANQIAISLTTKDFPILDKDVNTNMAVKECRTRSWFDSQVASFNNVDVETDCIVITDVENPNYKDYNGGYNYCYSRDNMGATIAKGAILVAQVGISFAFATATGGVGLLAAPVAGIIGTSLEAMIDNLSRWPRRDMADGISNTLSGSSSSSSSQNVDPDLYNVDI